MNILITGARSGIASHVIDRIITVSDVSKKDLIKQ